jgi:hypothetical protein
MGGRSWRERGDRPRHGAPQSVESWSTGEPQRHRGHSRRGACAGRQPAWVRQRRVHRTPPGSESGACLQRGHSGTWEHHRSPRITPGLGDRVTTGPGVTWGLRPGYEPEGDTTHTVKQARYREASDQRSDPRGAGGSLRGASYRGRWGTAPHGTPGRAGTAGHPVCLAGPLGATPGSPTVSMQRQSIAQQPGSAQ